MDTIFVYKISYSGTSYYDHDLKSVTEFLNNVEDRENYHVALKEVSKYWYENLREFQGF